MQKRMPNFSRPVAIIVGCILVPMAAVTLLGLFLCVSSIRQEAARLACIQRQPLFRAIHDHDVVNVKYLLDGGSDPNAYCDGIGPEDVPESALMYAAEVGDVNVVQLLIDKGAALNVVDGWGLTALDAAEDFHHKEVAALLQRQGARHSP